MTTFQHGYALVVGVGADLPNTVDDATGLSDLLQDPTRCAYPSQQVHLLTGEDATQDRILGELDVLAQSTNAQSTVIVYFSGHGYCVSSSIGEATYLLPYGYDLNRLYETAIEGRQFTRKLRAIPAQKLLLLLDCCHAGAIGEVKAPGLEFAKAPLPPEALTLLQEGQGQVIVASSRADELSFAGRPYSAFTLALIEALCGVGVATQDGYVRVSDVALHTREVVPRRTEGRQHPILHFEGADNFVLAYYAGGETQPKGLPFPQEPQIEPHPGAWTIFDQHGQALEGGQANVAGNMYGPVGVFHGPVTIGGGTGGLAEVEEEPPSPEATRLHRILRSRLDLEEFRTLCFDLGIGYDSLRGEGLSGKARQLVLYLQNREALPRLVAWLRRERPDIEA